MGVGDASDFVIWRFRHGYFVIWILVTSSSAVKYLNFVGDFESIVQKIILEKNKVCRLGFGFKIMMDHGCRIKI